MKLKLADLIALGFMTFALFLGAGNIIFPPIVGQESGEQFWWAATGFLLTGVGLPLAAIVALVRSGGDLFTVTRPIGRVAGTLFGVLIYLTIGPFFAIPRTTTVSFEVGVAYFLGDGHFSLFIYSVIYFALVILIALYPGRLIDTVGKYITPVLVIALLILGGYAVLEPAGAIGASNELYRDAPLSRGFLQGYLTMDGLAGLVFGIVIVNAIRARKVDNPALQIRYALIAAIIAAVGLALVYLSLVYLGATSSNVAPQADTGAVILAEYMHYSFGVGGHVLLAVVMTLACLTTAIGLTTACGEYFSRLLPVSYRTVVILFGLFSMVVANQGLERLITFSVPVLVGLYPVAMTLVVLSLLSSLWISAKRVFVPTLALAALMGVADGLEAAGLDLLTPGWLKFLPGASVDLAWLLPVFCVMIAAAVYDRLCSKKRIH
ncbi:MAG TPA: branched-chain amino acid transport system II carrier protein [Pusillimonas sp.]|jgi:LIVCS family branched-chain amino acid:cation transporter|nr:branched-chain amino acid transport system II carrier protein [Pusillimonas sp.]MBC41986.1 branched-chain amino acid transport system II carrier protein [Pusillimonas sp.]HBT31707.1 branched-chain amino acid transport system II carrier protein [Pusillimonas sp.]HCN70947.1 branched-chain amino acid transport system II carrier protein [Pusillimonas sp.]HCP79535.1 branched-chain amino acid transport system II carrier protein [Pusillimonas sp.]|tara:strand:- start:30565 stop:31869 length:1305 start_codon:yes stop_codon:yes gene_type:complete